MFLANRNDEIFARSKNREVIALINIFCPGVDATVDMANLGTIVKEGKRFTPGLTSSLFSQAAHVWQFDDTCVPLVEKDLKACLEVQSSLRERTNDLNRGLYKHLDFSQQAAIFESPDIIAKATGIPRLSLTFNESHEQTALALSTLPFGRLKDYLLAVNDKIEKISGKIESVTVAHKDSITAHDYYKIAQRKYHGGRTSPFEEIRQQRANEILDMLGIPKHVPQTQKLH